MSFFYTLVYTTLRATAKVFLLEKMMLKIFANCDKYPITQIGCCSIANYFNILGQCRSFWKG